MSDDEGYAPAAQMLICFIFSACVQKNTDSDDRCQASDSLDVNFGNFHMCQNLLIDSHVSHLACGLRPAGTARAARDSVVRKVQALPAVKIQVMRIALRTTHQSSSPQWGEVYVRLRRVVRRLGAITGGYSRKIFPPSRKRKKGKNALYIYRAPENGKRKFWGERPAAEVGFPVWI